MGSAVHSPSTSSSCTGGPRDSAQIGPALRRAALTALPAVGKRRPIGPGRPVPEPPRPLRQAAVTIGKRRQRGAGRRDRRAWAAKRKAAPRAPARPSRGSRAGRSRRPDRIGRAHGRPRDPNAPKPPGGAESEPRRRSVPCKRAPVPWRALCPVPCPVPGGVGPRLCLAGGRAASGPTSAAVAARRTSRNDSGADAGGAAMRSPPKADGAAAGVSASAGGMSLASRSSRCTCGRQLRPAAVGGRGRLMRRDDGRRAERGECAGQTDREQLSHRGGRTAETLGDACLLQSHAVRRIDVVLADARVVGKELDNVPRVSAHAEHAWQGWARIA
jgi:hypothetical protein